MGNGMHERRLSRSLHALAASLALLVGSGILAPGSEVRAANTASQPSHYLAVWGDGAAGPLGTTACCASRARPTAVPGMDMASAVASGGGFTVVVKPDGTVWGWGSNVTGVLGPEPRVQILLPRQIPGISNVVSVAAGAQFVLALTSDGAVWAWGGYPQTTTPTIVPGLSHVTRIAATEFNALAITSEGNLYSWGMNYMGQVGDGTRESRTNPVRIKTLSHVISAATSGDSAVAAEADGSVWAWGSDASGVPTQRGIIQSTVPVRVRGVPAATEVAAGSGYGLALLKNHRVWGWGQIGGETPPPGFSGSPPHRIKGLQNVVSIVAGTWHNMAIETDGSVWSWGGGPGAPARDTELVGATAVAISVSPHTQLALVSSPPPAPEKAQLSACTQTSSSGSLTGSMLSSLAVDQRSGHVFVVNGGAYTTYGPHGGVCTASVSMLDGHTGHIVRTLLVGAGTPSFALSPMTARESTDLVIDGERALVAFNPLLESGDTAGGISIINTTTGALLRSFSVDYEIRGVASDFKLGRVFIPHTSAAREQGIRITGNNGKTLHNVPVQMSGTPVVDRGASRFFLVGDTGSIAIDSRTGKIVHRTQYSGGSLLGVGIAAKAGRLFLAFGVQPHCCGPSIEMLDIHSGKLLKHLGTTKVHGQIVQVQPGPITVDASVGQVLIPEGQFPTPGRSVTTVRDTRTGRLLRTLSIVLGPSAVDSRNGYVYSITAPGTVTVLNPHGWRVVRTFHPGSTLDAIALDERTNRIFVIVRQGQGINGNMTVRSFCVASHCP